MTNEELKYFGQKLKELRRKRGITQKKLALHLHISRSCLANYESYHRRPDDDIVNEIASYFGVSVAQLLGHSAVTTSEACIPQMLFCQNPEKSLPDLQFVVSVYFHSAEAEKR